MCVLQHHSRRKDSVLVNGVSGDSGFYLLDPENNLPQTRKRLKDFLSTTSWEGITGSKPTHKQFKEALSKNDIFM